MLPKVKGTTKNVLVVAGSNGTRRYIYKNSFELDGDQLVRDGAKAAGKMLASGYDQVASKARELYRSYRVRKMMKEAKKSMKHLRAAIHL
jgi:hypothetical protein